MAEYAWLITKDHLAESDKVEVTDPYPLLESEVGTMGPEDADEGSLAALGNGHGKTFRMYDDDGILYYTGRMVVTGGNDADFAEYSDAPLRDFGGPNAGAVLIKWQGHPEWDSEY